VVIHLGLADRSGLARLRARYARSPIELAKSLLCEDDARSFSLTGDELHHWELPSGDGQRRLLVVADSDNEPAMDRWTWESDGHTLPPLTRYLLHAMTIRHQETAAGASLPRLRSAVARSERAAFPLVDLVRADEPAIAQLVTAARNVQLVQAEQGGLISGVADIRDMIETVGAARRNMATVLGEAVEHRADGPFARDDAAAAQLAGQLHVERTYLESAIQRSDKLAQMAGVIVEDRARRRQEVLAVFQASVLGCLLMALTAIQSLEYKVGLPGPLMAPVISTLATIALVLPASVLYWPRRGAPARRPWWFGVGGAAVGAGLGWLATATRNGPGPRGLIVPVVAAVVTGMIVWFAARRHRNQ
jgi:hypothetical protein